MCPDQKALQKEGQEKFNLYRSPHRQFLCCFKAVNFVICVRQTGNKISRARGFGDKLREASSKIPSRLFDVNGA